MNEIDGDTRVDPAAKSPAEYVPAPPLARLSGDERFRGIDATVLDFWRWAFNDLRDNTTRGVLAEFLVAKALGADDTLRVAWDIFDVLGPEAVRVEVKSSAYCQSWAQRRPSRLVFSGLTGRSWDESNSSFSVERELRADVYVFAIQTCSEPERYDPLDVEQWEFRVAAAGVLRHHAGRSVGMAFLERHASKRWSLCDLPRAILDAHAASRGRHRASRRRLPRTSEGAT